jgi:hypothetical protein
MESLHSQAMTQVEHPVQTLQKTKFNDAEARRLQEMRATMGWAAAANRAMTMYILGNTGRMGGLPSSRASLHHYAGMNTKFDFEDFLGLPQNKPNAQPSPTAFFEHEFDGAKLTLPTGQAPRM